MTLNKFFLVGYWSFFKSSNNKINMQTYSFYSKVILKTHDKKQSLFNIHNKCVTDQDVQCSPWEPGSTPADQEPGADREPQNKPTQTSSTTWGGKYNDRLCYSCNIQKTWVL